MFEASRHRETTVAIVTLRKLLISKTIGEIILLKSSI